MILLISDVIITNFVRQLPFARNAGNISAGNASQNMKIGYFARLVSKKQLMNHPLGSPALTAFFD